MTKISRLSVALSALLFTWGTLASAGTGEIGSANTKKPYGYLANDVILRDVLESERFIDEQGKIGPALLTNIVMQYNKRKKVTTVIFQYTQDELPCQIRADTTQGNVTLEQAASTGLKAVVSAISSTCSTN